MTQALLVAVLLAASSAAQAQHNGFSNAVAPQLSEQERAREEASLAAGRGYNERLAETLARTGDARELALAARLRRVVGATPVVRAPPLGNAPSQRVAPDDQATRWQRQAASRAGNDILANQLLADVDIGADADVRTQALERWRATEPRNLAPLLWQQTPLEELLQAARRMSHAETHMYDGIRWLASVYRRHPPTPAEQRAWVDEGPFHPDEFAAMSAMTLWSTIAMPVLQPLMDACRSEALRAAPTRYADCRNVATILADRSDSLILRHAGLGLLRQLAAEGEHGDIDARQRRMDWQMQRWGEIARAQERDGAAQFARLLADESIRSEQQMVERVLHEAGVPLEPPAGWVSPWVGR